jgi:hypothetical protein
LFVDLYSGEDELEGEFTALALALPDGRACKRLASTDNAKNRYLCDDLVTIPTSVVATAPDFTATVDVDCSR